MELSELLKQAVSWEGSDIFIVPGAPVTVKVSGQMKQIGDRLSPNAAETLVKTMYDLASAVSAATLTGSAVRRRRSAGSSISIFPIRNPCTFPRWSWSLPSSAAA